MTSSFCNWDHFLEPHTNTCMPCSYLCRPRYETPEECSHFCPGYMKELTTTRRTTTPFPVTQETTVCTPVNRSTFELSTILTILLVVFLCIVIVVLSVIRTKKVRGPVNCTRKSNICCNKGRHIAQPQEETQSMEHIDDSGKGSSISSEESKVLEPELRSLIDNYGQKPSHNRVQSQPQSAGFHQSQLPPVSHTVLYSRQEDVYSVVQETGTQQNISPDPGPNRCMVSFPNTGGIVASDDKTRQRPEPVINYVSRENHLQKWEPQDTADDRAKLLGQVNIAQHPNHVPHEDNDIERVQQTEVKRTGTPSPIPSPAASCRTSGYGSQQDSNPEDLGVTSASDSSCMDSMDLVSTGTEINANTCVVQELDSGTIMASGDCQMVIELHDLLYGKLHMFPWIVGISMTSDGLEITANQVKSDGSLLDAGDLYQQVANEIPREYMPLLHFNFKQSSLGTDYYQFSGIGTQQSTCAIGRSRDSLLSGVVFSPQLDFQV